VAAQASPGCASACRAQRSHPLWPCFAHTAARAVITGTSPHAARYNSISDLRGEAIGISRIGSGSMVMASVMALQQRWLDAQGAVEAIPFKVQDTFVRLRNAVNFPASAPKETPGEAAQVKDSGHISKEAFEKGAREYMERHAAAVKSSALGAHVYAEGWQLHAGQVSSSIRCADGLC
jgi:hypothetical protein